MSHKCRGFLALALFLLLQLRSAEMRCNKPEELANGTIMQRRNFLRFRCFTNYFLMGKATLSCGFNGRLSGEQPFCARSGCTPPPNPENGEFEIQRGLAAVLMCKDEFVVAGNALAYCNGNNWDRTLGVCRHRNHTQSHACDFESEDLCGWLPQLALIQPWRRVSTVAHFHSYRTGPRHDHTLQSAYGGHYMLMETTNFASGSHHLVSPIYPRELSLKTACCFRFHYFMYGSGVGDLVVSVKPHQMRVEQMWMQYRKSCTKFQVSGNQGNQWLEFTISIDEMPDDFQIVFTATDASALFGDIAIDDVRLMTGSECGGGGYTTTTETAVVDNLEPVVYDMMNCSRRCGEPAPLDDEMRADGKLIKSCGCDELCVDLENCCLDYFSRCVVKFEETTEEVVVTTPTTTTTTTRKTSTRKSTAKTTTSTTTTTPKPTTTTTRRIPTTVKTTTTTTRKIPTTTTKTSTRATTRSTTLTIPTTTTSTTRATTTQRTTSTTTTTGKTTTTTPASTTTTTPATTTTTLQYTTAHPTHSHRNRITWPVHPDDIKGDSDKQISSNPARFMWFLMLAIMLIVIVGSVLYRWRRPNGAAIEKAVSFQKTFAKLKSAALSRGNRSGRHEASAPLVSGNDNGDYDDVQFEEMGVDIRNVSEL